VLIDFLRVRVPFSANLARGGGSILLAAIVLSACGGARAAGPDRAEQLLSSQPARSSACVVETIPETLPNADMVVDSAELASGVLQMLRADPPPAGHVLLTLEFGVDGVNIRRDVLEHSTGPLVADSIQKLVFAARRQVEESEEAWGVRLRLDLAEGVAMRVGRREFCPPMPRDRSIEEAMQSYTPAGVRYRGGRRERVVPMRAYVNSSGFITSAHIARGVLRGSSLESGLVNFLRQFLFEPATLDGLPTGAWVEIPVRVPA
jgi:hypothetical protein